MKIVIYGHHLTLPRDLGTFLNKHVTTPLARVYDNQAAQLTVRLGDDKPHKGGRDRACRLVFRIPGARTVTVSSLQDDLYAALLDCSDRLRRVVQKELGKQRSGGRHPQHRPLGRSYRLKASRQGVTLDGTPATL
jgi:hypothetical protein